MRALHALLLTTFGLTSCMTPTRTSEPSPPPAAISPDSPTESSAPTEEPTAHQVGRASFYGDQFQGQRTATGERFSQDKLTAASPDLPLGTNVTVTNRQNGKSVDVEVNDRGPNVDGRVIDLSKSAAKRIGIDKKQGVAPVTVEAKPSKQPTQELKDAVLEKAGSPSPD